MVEESRFSFCPRESILDNFNFLTRRISKEIPSLFRGNDPMLVSKIIEGRKKKYFLAKRIESKS